MSNQPTDGCFGVDLWGAGGWACLTFFRQGSPKKIVSSLIEVVSSSSERPCHRLLIAHLLNTLTIPLWPPQAQKILPPRLSAPSPPPPPGQGLPGCVCLGPFELFQAGVPSYKPPPLVNPAIAYDFGCQSVALASSSRSICGRYSLGT